MKTVGILGGLGPEATMDYYKKIISSCRKKTGQEVNPNILINSIDIFEMLRLVKNRNFDSLIGMLANGIKSLTDAGSDFVAIASNTPHIVFDQLVKLELVEMISIVEATCRYARALGCKKILLTGTLFTMRENFYKKVAETYDLEIVTPNEAEQMQIHDIIFPELQDGIVIPEKKRKLVQLVNKITARERVDAVILGCTELPLMISATDLSISVLNTSQCHISEIVERILC